MYSIADERYYNIGDYRLAPQVGFYVVEFIAWHTSSRYHGNDLLMQCFSDDGLFDQHSDVEINLV